MKTILYDKYITFEAIEQVEDAMTIEDVRAFKKIYSKLQNDMAAKRMFGGIGGNSNFSCNDFKAAFYLGWLAAHCVDVNTTPLGKALTED